MSAASIFTCPTSCRGLLLSEQEFSFLYTYLVKDILSFLFTGFASKKKKKGKKKPAKINALNFYCISLGVCNIASYRHA